MDPITRTLQFLVNYIGIDVDIKFWSQYVSFLVIGLIVLTSIRGLLINLTKVCNCNLYYNPFNNHILTFFLVFLCHLLIEIFQYYRVSVSRIDGHVLCFFHFVDANEYAIRISYYYYRSSWRSSI